MLTFFIILVLAWQYYIGYSRGLLLQAAYTVGSLLSLFLASLFYKPLSDFLYLWIPYASPAEGDKSYFFDEQHLFNLDKVFYAGIAFFILYLLFYSLIRFLGIFLHLFDFDRLDKQVRTRYLAGALSVLITWLGMAMLLTIAATIPATPVQDYLHKSLMAKLMINTPIFSSLLQNLWLIQ